MQNFVGNLRRNCQKCMKVVSGRNLVRKSFLILTIRDYKAVEITLLRPNTIFVGGRLSVKVRSEDIYFSWSSLVLVDAAGGNGRFKKHTAVSELFLWII